MWESCIRAFTRKGFNPKLPLDVKFTNADGNEGAVDLGGPTRELFNLLSDELKNRNIFDNTPLGKVLSMDINLLSKKHYFMAGMTIALSIAHIGVVPRVFSSLLFKAAIGESLEEVSWISAISPKKH